MGGGVPRCKAVVLAVVRKTSIAVM